MGSVILTSILGAVIGAIARLVITRSDSGGLITSIAVGLAGAMVGAFICVLNGIVQAGSAPAFAIAAGASIASLIVYRAFHGAAQT